MTDFTEAFRKNVTIRGALSAMLFSEERLGDDTLARKTKAAIENMHSDILILSGVHYAFSATASENDALNELLVSASNLLRSDKQLLPDEAILQTIENHQLRKYPTVKDAQDRVDLLCQARALAMGLLKSWEGGSLRPVYA